MGNKDQFIQIKQYYWCISPDQQQLLHHFSSLMYSADSRREYRSIIGFIMVHELWVDQNLAGLPSIKQVVASDYHRTCSELRRQVKK